jgi:hypothetical protein
MRHVERMENATPGSVIAMAAGMAVCLFASHARAQEPPKAAEVEAAMKAPGKQEAFAACAAGKTTESTVKLEIVISKDGAFSLASTAPVLGDEVLSCLTAAVAAVKMRPVDRDYRMVYSLSLSPGPGAKGGVTEMKLQKIQTDPRLHEFARDYRKGVGILSGGIALGVVSVVGIWLSWIPHIWSKDCSHDDDSCSRDSALLATSICMKVFFAIGAGAGIAMIVVGARKMEKAIIARNRVFFSGLDLCPTAGATGAVLTSSFRF